MLRKAILLFLLLFCYKAQASEDNLVISEIMYDVDGSDSSHEWIELYNSGQDSLTVTSTWRFFDYSNHKINLYSGTSTILGHEFFILADNGEQFLLDYPNFSGNLFDTVMSLPNSSSSIGLSFDEGENYNLFESYTSTWGGNGNGYSLEKVDIYASSTNNWQESLVVGGTPGQLNSEEVPKETIVVPEVEEDIQKQDWSPLVINELMPNPEGSDDNEWIELYNNGQEALNLEGLQIKDNSSRVFTLASDSDLNLWLLAHRYLLLPKRVTGISLNNSNGDSVSIIDLDNNVIDFVEYTDIASEGKSYARTANGFLWTKTPSPGNINKISVNQAPVSQISVDKVDFVVGEKLNFSAQYAYDPEGEELDYFWEFGDGKTSSRKTIKHNFDSFGDYTVRLKVIDPEGASDVSEFSITIYQDSKEESKTGVQSKEEIEYQIDIFEDDLIISEFIPNPEGSDDHEWIELYNNSNKDIDLNGWYLDDSEGGSKPYRFSTSTMIRAGQYFVLDREKTKITLNNKNDSVRLLDPLDNLWQEVNYESVLEGKTYAFDLENDEWMTNDPSPGLENLFIDFKEPEIIYSVSEISDLDKNMEVTVQGVAINNVSVDNRSLYLAEYNFSNVNFENILEIYSHYKLFPEIEAGDLVTVFGKISKLSDVPRVKIKTAEDIWKNDVTIEYEKPEIIDVEDIDEDLVGVYATIRGVVVKKSGKSVYISPHIDEEYILRVYSRFSTKELNIKKEDEIIATGILDMVNDSLKLIPFKIGDISVSKKVLGEKIKEDGILEDDLSTSTDEVVVDDRKNKVQTALIFISIFLVLIIIFYTIKNRQNKKGLTS